MTPDMKLSPHFSLYELTTTSNEALQSKNRELTLDQVQKLLALAQHCEMIRSICGAAVKIHSGYRSEALNGATHGSSSTSQHPRCEAVDLDVPGQDLGETFRLLHEAARAGRFRFGQLILESAARPYGAVSWVHCSLAGTLDPAKVGQVMHMVAGEDGKQHYALIEKMDFPKEA